MKQVFTKLSSIIWKYLVAWSIICNIRIPLIDFKSAATTLKSFEREKLTAGLNLSIF